ncbi:MAG TPA: glycosyltransferase, partial [Longimicrobiales bacterium]|nr:glycosyltransferase [Longimicrobiales bacterium]
RIWRAVLDYPGKQMGEGSSSPATESKRERLTRGVAVLSLVVSTAYIIWRWFFTLNPDALWFSIPLAVAETYGLITAFFLTFTAWRLRHREPVRPLFGRSVDVFITTYNEPISVIRKTALAAREIRYAHKTYILDDGRRDEIRLLCAELGVGYIRRDNNEHAKAGNLNNALKNTSGEFVLQLDADHVPLPNIVERMIGYFEDEQLAFVQSPQDFYNTDGFTYEVDEKARRIWEDQQLFFRVLQPGKDAHGAAFFVGSCALLRRGALEDIGGFATGTITEDIETSLLLHSRGWKSAYVNETLAYGLAPVSATAFHTQHLRWGQGAMQAMRRYHPLRMKGLSVAQRLAYFDSLSTYLGGFQRLILYLAPIAFFFTGEFPLRTNATQFALIFAPYIGLQLLSFKLLARGHGSLLLADRYSMAKFFTHIMSVTGYSRRRKLRFKVTPKGSTADVPIGTYAPQLALIVVSVVAILWSIPIQFATDVYEVTGWGPLAFWVNLGFAMWNGSVAAGIVRMSLRMKQKRADHRFAESMPVHARIFRADGKLNALHVGVVENLNPQGVALRSSQALEDGTRIEIALPLSTRTVNTRGRVVHRREQPGKYGVVHVHGVRFDELDWDSRDAIELHCAHHSTPITRQQYGEGSSNIAGYLFRELRGERRVQVGMPAQMIATHEDEERHLGLALLEDMSTSGARVLTDHPLALGSKIRLEIAGSELHTRGVVSYVRPLETNLGIRFVIGLDTRMAGEPVVARTLILASAQWLRTIQGSAKHYTNTALRYTNTAAKLTVDATRRLKPTTAPKPVAPAPAPAAPVAAPVAREAVEAAAAPTTTLVPVEMPLPFWAGERKEQHEVVEVQEFIEEVSTTPTGDETMAIQEYAPRPADAAASLLSITGSGARIEGRFDIANSIEIECEVTGELNVGGKLVIGRNGNVAADVRTVDALILGSFTGNLSASGSIEIASTGRVSGNVETPEFVIGKGGVFTGNVTRPSEQAASSSPTISLSPAQSGIPGVVAIPVESLERAASQ